MKLAQKDQNRMLHVALGFMAIASNTKIDTNKSPRHQTEQINSAPSYRAAIPSTKSWMTSTVADTCDKTV